MSVSFNKDTCEITIDGKKVEIRHKYGKLFQLDVLSNYNLCQLANPRPNRNYGINVTDIYENLKMLKSKNVVNGMNVDVNKLPRCCERCALGKQHRNSFPKTSDNLTKQPLEIIHSDVCGPMNVDSIKG